MAPWIFGTLCPLAVFPGFWAARPEVPRFETVDGNTVSVNESVLFFDVSLDELVGQGWGSRVLYMGAMQGQFVNEHNDRMMAMPHQTLMTYTAFDLHPPVTTFPQDAFGSMLADMSHTDVADMQLASGQRAGDQMINFWANKPFARVFYNQALQGCWDNFDSFIWQMFEQVVSNHEKPFADYIGMHIRHGDKVEEGAIIDLGTVMSVVQTTPDWKDINNFFVATDDLNVLEKEVHRFHPPQDPLALSSQHDGYAWNWTESRHRHRGGEPGTCEHGHCHHENTAGSIQAVLDDTVTLARASVLVGSFNSNFFKLPWLLNYLRRTPEQRQEKWCWDVYTKKPCHDRFNFSLSFTRKVNGGVGFTSDNTDMLRGCLNPALERNQ